MSVLSPEGSRTHPVCPHWRWWTACWCPRRWPGPGWWPGGRWRSSWWSLWAPGPRIASEMSRCFSHCSVMMCVCLWDCCNWFPCPRLSVTAHARNRPVRTTLGLARSGARNTLYLPVRPWDKVGGGGCLGIFICKWMRHFITIQNHTNTIYFNFSIFYNTS